MFDFVIYVDKSGAFRFKMVAKNGERLNDNYTQLHNAKSCVDQIKLNAADAKVYMESEDGHRTEITL